MKFKIHSLFIPVVIGAAVFSRLQAEPIVKIIQPYENQKLRYVTQSFVFGNLTPATATLTINGTLVTPYRNGGFLVMIPFQEGSFPITAYASDGVSSTTVVRTVSVGAPNRPFAADSSVIEPISPRGRVVLRPDDDVELSFQGAPGGTATFRIGGRHEWFPMRESPSSVGGIYKGLYRLRETDEFEDADVLFQLERAKGKKSTKKAGAQITIQKRSIPRIIELKEKTTLLTGPGSDFGYSLFLLEGVRMEVTGEMGDYYRVSLAANEDGWVRKSSCTELPAGTLPPKSISRNVRIDASDESTIIDIPLQARHAHRIEELSNPYRLRLTLYGVTADTDRIRYKTQKSIVKDMNWIQHNNTATILEIPLRQQQGWGYDARYEGSRFILEIRHQPKVNISRGALKGLRVAVDAGHSQHSYGTIGPWGNTEASVNLSSAKTLQKELERRGADVVLVQDGTKELSLQDRLDFAWVKKAHVFISLHCDATDDGVDPRESEGYSVHYYHPQSRVLSEILYSLYGGVSGIRDQGIWRSNLAVCRTTQMPSLLFEMGFLVIPETEAKLVSLAHQKIVATTVSQALVAFLSRFAQ